MTYATVARRSGSPRAARAVGTILKKNFDSKIPCHRVVPANARFTPDDLWLGEYNRGRSTKIKKLREEGVLLKNK